MKVILLSMAICTLSASSFSQTATHRNLFADNRQATQTASTSVSLKDSSYSYLSWNNSSPGWGRVIKNIYAYNAAYEETGNFSKELISGVWTDYKRNKGYQYDANHRLLDVSTEWWTSSWNNNVRNMYTYDAAGNTLTETEQVWASGAWKNNIQVINTYSGNNITSSLRQYWNTGTSIWDNASRSTYTYTGSQCTLALFESWHSGIWMTDARQTNYVYSGSDLTSYDIETWDAGNSAYVPFGKESYTYDSGHRMLSHLTQEWNFSILDNFEKTDYTYDTYGNETKSVLQRWDAASASWKLRDVIENYYTTTNSSVGMNERSSSGNIKLYPNPASEHITVSVPGNEASTLTITDLSGKTVLKSETDQADHFSIDIRALEAGMYFMELKNTQGSAKGKFIKN